MSVSYEFCVEACLKSGERVCVIGDCAALGHWNPDSALRLQQDANKSDTYVGKMMIEEDVISYRYIVMSGAPKIPGLPFMTKDGEEMRLQSYESHEMPREQKRSHATPVDVYGNQDGLIHIEHGWLTRDSVVQLKVLNDAVKIFSESLMATGKEIQPKLNLRVSTMRISVQNGDACYSERKRDRLSEPFYCDLNETECKEFRPQPEDGVPIALVSDACLVFQIAILVEDVEETGFLLEVLVDVLPSERFSSVLLPSQLQKSSIGVTVIPIISLKRRVVGQMAVEHLEVKPMRRVDYGFLGRLYSRNWRSSWVGLGIGHRGMGKSSGGKDHENGPLYTRENTVRSFMEAGIHGADMIELDIHLTSDKVPVVYHDFFVPVKLASSIMDSAASKFRLSICHHTLEQLHEIVASNATDAEVGVWQADPLSKPFPTLKTVASLLDLSVGMNVELKYPSSYPRDSTEFENPFDLNEYVDEILRTVEENLAKRLIVLSCFNPNVCIALKWKQPAFPVLFLTQGVTTKWPPYSDPRTKSTDMAIRFARCFKLAGVSCHAEEMLHDPQLVKAGLSDGLIMFVWGEDTKNRQVMDHWKALGVHGIIVDRVDALIGKMENKSCIDAMNR